MSLISWNELEQEAAEALGLLKTGVVTRAEAGTSQTDNRARTLDDPPPDLKNHIESSYNGKDILLVMEKTITASDIDEKQNRLLFGVNNVKNQFLITQEEKNKVNQPGGLQVSVIDPCFETIPGVKLKKRTKKESQYSAYVLTGNWSKIPQNEMNHLRKNDTVRLWSFRHGSELFFALVKT
ncbi:hypothetical protein Dsin_003880 [Dipteronia sinensis]|uniref:TF-B3 domain-containing protein n=1 Tax=Dipteronia sinensis TaxID=43782 RepID=A0AAE0EL29_9ROSI|nr:hypothetical protein Dsin_003880 [Dipteronia sinensis]